MEISLFDIFLINIISYLGGLLTGFGICHRCKQKESHCQTVNNQSPNITGISASAPPPFAVMDNPVMANYPKQSGTEIVIKNPIMD